MSEVHNLPQLLLALSYFILSPQYIFICGSNLSNVQLFLFVNYLPFVVESIDILQHFVLTS